MLNEQILIFPVLGYTSLTWHSVELFFFLLKRLILIIFVNLYRPQS